MGESNQETGDTPGMMNDERELQQTLPTSGLTEADRLALYRWMRLTRTLEERLVALYRQSKVIGGLFRSLGQEACAVGSAYALHPTDAMAPLIRNLGSMLVKGATPVEVLRQYMAKADSPTHGRELNIHFGDVERRHFIGQISHLGDMVPVMAGVTLTFKLRNEARAGLVYVGDGATSTGAFHEGLTIAGAMHCPMVTVVENNGYAYSTPTAHQCAAERLVDKAVGYGMPGVRVDGNDVLAVHAATTEALERARNGGGPSLIECMTFRRKGHAEHDDQRYVAQEELERWATTNDPIDRWTERLVKEFGVDAAALQQIDDAVRVEVDTATDLALESPPCEGPDSLIGVYAAPHRMPVQWYRGEANSAVDEHERPASWGSHVD